MSTILAAGKRNGFGLSLGWKFYEFFISAISVVKKEMKEERNG
jgi:hypothetical protein